MDLKEDIEIIISGNAPEGLSIDLALNNIGPDGANALKNIGLNPGDMQ